MRAASEHRDLWWPSPAGELGTVVRLGLEAPLRTVRGGELAEIQVHYQSWGELAPQRDNVVLVVHPLAMDSHLTGQFAEQPLGWWEPLAGPGRALDTDRYFVVCPNLLGGCYGTTGPRFPAPDGAPYLDRFPLLTPRDLMRFQQLFLRELGIERPRLVIGPSMGGMVAWEWAVCGGEDVEAVVVVAAPPQASPLEIGWNWIQRRGIELDLAAEGETGRAGRALARAVGMLSYRSAAGLAEKFGRGWFREPGRTLAEPGLFNVESWLLHHGRKSVKRFDPYSYLLFARVMDLHDVAYDHEDLDAALARTRCRLLAVGIDSDQLYPAREVREGVEHLQQAGVAAVYREISSAHGHDAFLLEAEQLTRILRDFGV